MTVGSVAKAALILKELAVAFTARTKDQNVSPRSQQSVEMLVKVHSYYAAIALRYPTAQKLRCYCTAVSQESLIYFYLTCGKAAVTCGRKSLIYWHRNAIVV